MVMEDDLQKLRSEKAYLVNFSEENMNRGNVPEVTPKTVSRKKLEGSLHVKYLSMFSFLGNRIQPSIHSETHELSPFIPDRVRGRGSRGVEAA